MSRSAIVGNVFDQWRTHAGGARTVLFASTIEHSKKLVERFRAFGVNAEHLDGKTPRGERGAILRRLEDGVTTVVSNVGVLTEGWDSPRVECCILARPTKSLGLFLQMVGRVLRPVCRDCKGDTVWSSPVCRHCGSVNVKRAARLHDHAGCVLSHGLPDASRDWSLDVRPPRGKRDQLSAEAAGAVRSCEKCFALYDPSLPACPLCGHGNARATRQIEEVNEGVQAIPLETLAERGKGADVTAKMSELRRLVSVARARSLPYAWVMAQYKSTFGEPPKWRFQL
jgi:superfamily II DNA or RNA helicase